MDQVAMHMAARDRTRPDQPDADRTRRHGSAGDGQAGRLGGPLEMRMTELGIDCGIGYPRVLLGLLDDPAAIIRFFEGFENRWIVDDAVSRRCEDAGQDRLREAGIATPASFERVASDVLAVDVIDPCPKRPDRRHRIAA